MRFIIENMHIIAPIVSGVLGWTGSYGLRKVKLKGENNNVIGGEIDLLSQNFKVYQELINDLENRFKMRITELEEDLERIVSLNRELRNALSTQERYIKKLKLKLKSYEELE